MTAMRGWIACLMLLSLAACQREAAAPGATGPSPEASASAAASVGVAAVSADSAPPGEVALGSFRIVSVLLGNALAGDQVVALDADSFNPDDAIHASVLSVGAHQGLRLSAKWLAPDGSTIADTQQPLVPVAATATTFSISNPRPWPEGEYRLSISINGQPARERKFQVR